MSLADKPLEDIDFRVCDDDTLRRYIELAEMELSAVRTEHAKLNSLMDSLKEETFKRFKGVQCKQSPQSA